MISLRAGALALALSATAAPAQPQMPARGAPSFSCQAAGTPVEKAICADPALARADREMAALFALTRTSAFGQGPSNQLTAQRAALRGMRSCARDDRTRLKECLAGAYDRRNAQLAVAALMSAPETALATARRVDPGFAPVLEAVWLWAAEPVDADWSRPQRALAKARIAKLLSPYLKDLLTQEDQSFGRSILTDPGTDGMAVTSTEDLFKSDRHFAAFLNVLGPYLPEAGPDGRRTLPCAAIVRHPALLRATGSLFGSTMDNFVFDNDCEHSLPPTPALATLDEKLTRAWPECDGTIRFAAYRSYATALDEARLGRGVSDPKGNSPTRRGVTAADVTAARTELADYYTRYLGKIPAQAAAMAKDAVAAVLSSAQECGG
jgi:uncharacterized protein